MKSIITIDGPAGSGKSTISRTLSNKLGYMYLDTGAMYRAVALAAVIKGLPLGDEKKMGEMCRELDITFSKDEGAQRIFLDNKDISKDIRSPEMDMLSSRISGIPQVRDAMTHLQRKMSQGGCVVAEGRDMGTVVFPDAEYKFFLSASSDVRAKRRYLERKARGEAVSLEIVLEQMKERDHQDAHREVAPLQPAEDAIIIDSTELTPEQVLAVIIKHLDVK